MAAVDGILKRRIYGIVPYFGAKQKKKKLKKKRIDLTTVNYETYRTIMGYPISLRGRRYSSGIQHTTKTENY